MGVGDLSNGDDENNDDESESNGDGDVNEHGAPAEEKEASEAAAAAVLARHTPAERRHFNWVFQRVFTTLDGTGGCNFIGWVDEIMRDSELSPELNCYMRRGGSG